MDKDTQRYYLKLVGIAVGILAAFFTSIIVAMHIGHICVPIADFCAS